jgi:hypothetical protein
MKVARHAVPGMRQKRIRPGGNGVIGVCFRICHGEQAWQGPGIIHHEEAGDALKATIFPCTTGTAASRSSIS